MYPELVKMYGRDPFRLQKHFTDKTVAQVRNYFMNHVEDLLHLCPQGKASSKEIYGFGPTAKRQKTESGIFNVVESP